MVYFKYYVVIFNLTYIHIVISRMPITNMVMLEFTPFFCLTFALRGFEQTDFYVFLYKIPFFFKKSVTCLYDTFLLSFYDFSLDMFCRRTLLTGSLLYPH